MIRCLCDAPLATVVTSDISENQAAVVYRCTAGHDIHMQIQLRYLGRTKAAAS